MGACSSSFGSICCGSALVAFVRAIQGCGYFDAAKITYALCTCANVKYILTDCLLGTVSAGGTFLVMFCGSAGGGLIGYAIGGSSLAPIGFLLGFITGGIAA